MIDLTEDERRAISSLQRLAKRWPKSLWLFSASGTLNVMKHGPDGDRLITPSGGMDGSASIVTIAIDNDGGDW